MAKTADGQPISMETFCIAVAKALDLPGFGENALEDKDGHFHAINSAEDYYLRVAANIAFMGEQPVAPASHEDIFIKWCRSYSSYYYCHFKRRRSSKRWRIFILSWWAFCPL